MSKLLSALPRIIVPISDTPITLGVGLQTVRVPLWDATAPAPRNQPLSVPFLNKFRFDGSVWVLIDTPHQGAVSLESAGLTFRLASNGNLLLAQSARLSSLSALAQNQLVTFDAITIDGTELSFAGQAIGANPQLLNVYFEFTFNNTAGTAATLSLTGSFSQQQAIYDSYDFPAAP